MHLPKLLPQKVFPLAVSVVTLTVGLTVLLGADLLNLRDRDLVEKTRETVGTRDGDGAPNLPTEFGGRKPNLLVQEVPRTCDEAIDLPQSITDWRFKGAARQAYITAAKDRQLAGSACGCLFADYPFAAFTGEMLDKAPAALSDNDRPTFETYLAARQRDVEGRYRTFESSCRSE